MLKVACTSLRNSESPAFLAPGSVRIHNLFSRHCASEFGVRVLAKGALRGSDSPAATTQIEYRENQSTLES
jgi:hypothetical protein